VADTTHPSTGWFRRSNRDRLCCTVELRGHHAVREDETCTTRLSSARDAPALWRQWCWLSPENRS